MLRIFKAGISILICISVFCGMSVNLSVYANSGISASSAIVIDKNSKRVLSSKNSDKQMGMASTTKIMTALVALENGDLNSVVKISPSAAGVEGSSMYLTAGEEITLENLIYGLMLVSGNDAATAIAEHISGSVEKFAGLMNEKAQAIGAKNTHFDNPHGLSADTHYTTAYDLALITAYALDNPKFKEIVSTKSKKIPWQGKNYDRQLKNHNKFLSLYEGCIGVKTGFTKATGRCLVTAVEKDNLTLVCVTLNAPDDWNDHKILYDSAFNEYKAFKIKEKASRLEIIDAGNAENDNVYGVVKNDLYFPIKEGETVNINYEPYSNLTAPINCDKDIGKIYAEINGEKFFVGFAYPETEILEKRIILSDTKTTSDFKEITIKIFRTWIDVFKR